MRELTGHSIFAFESNDYDEAFGEFLEFIEENSFVTAFHTAEETEGGVLYVFTVVV